MSRGVVLVTGASTGIGRAAAVRLAAAGYDVVPALRRNELWGKGNAAVDRHLDGLTEDQMQRYSTQIDGGRKAPRISEDHAITPDSGITGPAARQPRGK
jgi:NAD(P)-dependent dehydrogenase (short-subunit alcohol dehydrogenase family)